VRLDPLHFARTDSDTPAAGGGYGPLLFRAGPLERGTPPHPAPAPAEGAVA
jgi:hypothetical protein